MHWLTGWCCNRKEERWKGQQSGEPELRASRGACGSVGEVVHDMLTLQKKEGGSNVRRDCVQLVEWASIIRWCIRIFGGGRRPVGEKLDLWESEWPWGSVVAGGNAAGFSVCIQMYPYLGAKQLWVIWDGQNSVVSETSYVRRGMVWRLFKRKQKPQQTGDTSDFLSDYLKLPYIRVRKQFVYDADLWSVQIGPTSSNSTAFRVCLCHVPFYERKDFERLNESHQRRWLWMDIYADVKVAPGCSGA